jgi:hypothetical protein
MYIILAGLSIIFKCTSTSPFTFTTFMNILYNTFYNQEVQCTKDHFRQVKVPGTTPEAKEK